MEDGLDLQSVYNAFVEMMGKMFPPAETPFLKFQVSELTQKKQIEILKLGIDSGRFFFTVNCLNKGEISNCHGLEKWLGISDFTFSYKHYLSLMHPTFLPTVLVLANASHQIANNSEVKVGFMSHSYLFRIPLLSPKNGDNYILCSRSLSPWQIDNFGRVVEYLNSFSIIGEYHETDSLSPIIFNNFNRDIDLEKQLRVITSNLFSKPFSNQQMNILRIYAYHSGISVIQVSEILRNSPETIKSLNKKILKKADFIFFREFDTVESLSKFMRESFLL